VTQAGRGARLGPARRRVSAAKRKLVALSAASFLAVVGLAWSDHPGKSATQSVAPSTSSSTDDGESSFDFGSGSVTPQSNATPSVQTHAS
jgi:hypothetical protein